MTKTDAIKKISKLRRLAERPGSQQEAENARREISRLTQQFSLSESDLTKGIKAEAFDDLAGKLDAYARKNQDKLPAPAIEVIEQLKKKMTEEEKAGALEKLVGTVRLASLILGKSKMGGIKEVVEKVLNEYGVVV